MMNVDEYEITMDDARLIARRVVSADKSSQPLVGKEGRLHKVLLRAQRAHREALDIDTFRREQVRPTAELKSTLDKALVALNDTPVNLAFHHSELDERYTDADSQRDLRGLLRRASKYLGEKNGLLQDLLDRHDLDGKLPRAIRGHPDKINSVGLRAAVEIMSNFWCHEIKLPFSDDFGKSLNDIGEDGSLKPKGLAAKFVYEVARTIDPAYTAEACSNAMRPR